MRAEDLTEAWMKKDLTQQAVRKYIQENLLQNSRIPLMFSELDHISNLCHHIYLWSVGKLPALGHFLTYVVENKLTEAVHAADDVNLTSLWIYPAFLYNVAPAGWKTMMEEQS